MKLAMSQRVSMTGRMWKNKALEVSQYRIAWLYIHYSTPYIFLSVGRNQIPQSSSCLIIGSRVFPVSVKEYSEWGGSSAKIFFSMTPCISNSFNCWLITLVFASGKCFWISLGRFAPSFYASIMQHFHLPPMTSIVTLIQQSMLNGIFFSYIFLCVNFGCKDSTFLQQIAWYTDKIITIC